MPYYGDWVWAVAFADQTYQGGVMTIAVKGAASSSVLNSGGGRATVCDVNSSTCSDNGDLGLVATTVVDGAAYLTVAEVTTTSAVRWLGIDDDGQVGTDSKGRPELVGGQIGSAVWGDPSSSSAQDAAFAMIQVDTTPSAQAGSGTLARQLGTELSGRFARSSRLQKTNDLRARALAVASALADQR